MANANSVIGEKRCTICGTTKSFTEFPMKRHEKSGSQRYDSRCRQCRSKRVRSPEGRELRRNYYRANREMIKRLVRESYLRQESKRSACRTDLKRSRQKICESYARHADRRRADRRLYCREHPELVRQSNALAREKRRASGSCTSLSIRSRQIIGNSRSSIKLSHLWIATCIRLLSYGTLSV
jgi:hypothetical protein